MSESGRTPGSEVYPRYWPRTTCLVSIGFSASNTFSFSSRMGFSDSDTGGSMARNPMTWKRWVTTMSR